MKFMPVDRPATYDAAYDAYVNAGISKHGSTQPDFGYSPISSGLHDECYRVITPLISAWCGLELVRSFGYGIRTYGRGSVLHLHRDRVDTHVISCIIHVDDEADRRWPLDFIDHDGVHHRVTFDRGDVLFYESLCPHARLEPFAGNYYRNMYFHWRPVAWDGANYLAMRAKYPSLEACLAEFKKSATEADRGRSS